MSDSSRMRKFLSESAVIVASILLAFWIDAWWDQSQAERSEATVLESVREEADENRRELDRLFDRNDSHFERLDIFLRMTTEELRALPPDSVTPWLAAMVVTWTFDGDDSAAGLFLNSSAPVTAHAATIRGALARWVRIVDDLEEEKRGFWEAGVEVADRLAVHVSAAQPDGVGLLHEVTARQGPDLLAVLRGDDGFIAALLKKASYQSVYALELAEASTALDSLRNTIEQGIGPSP